MVLSPTSITANTRLGQIELSLGNYESAKGHLAAAFAAAPRRTAIRQLFGESLAVSGDVDGAAAVWRPLSPGVDQLSLREAWYRSIGEWQHAEWIRDAAARATAK